MMISAKAYAEKTNTEHAHQVAVFMWAAMEAPQQHRADLQEMFAIPNGGERNKAVAARLKAEGVKSGVPDIMLPVPRGRHHGLFIEMKRPKSARGAKGRESVKQSERMQRLASRGYASVTCIGWEAACTALLIYLGLGPFDNMPTIT